MVAMAIPAGWRTVGPGSFFRRAAGCRARRHAGHHHGWHFAHHGGFPPPIPPGPWPPPGGPAFGGPRGPFGFHGPRGGRGPRARRGDVRTGILLLLAEKPMSGYEIIKEGRERSNGVWRLSPGSVYPVLQQLESEGLVTLAATGVGRRRPYELTEQGHAYVAEHAAELTPPWESAAQEYEETHARHLELASLASQLTAAVAQVSQVGTDAQVERVKQLLVKARKSVYRILAEDDLSDDEEL